MIRYLLLLVVLVAVRPGMAQTLRPATPSPPVDLRTDLIRRQDEGAKVYSKFPLLSWVLPSGKQTAYQILLATDNGMQSPWWNSGRVVSNENVGNLYHGKALEPSRIYYWKVRTWSGVVAGPYSEIQAFATGDTLQDFGLPSFVLRKERQEPVSVRAGGVNTSDQGRVVYDFGKDGFGQLEVTVSADRLDTLVVALGEALAADGGVNSKPPGTVRFRRIRVPLLPGSRSYAVVITPDERNTGPKAIRMPAHIGEVMPFRYAEVAPPALGHSDPPRVEAVSRYLISAGLDDSAVDFVSSDTLLNKIWELCKYSVKATSFTGFYVDGDRERIPYEADALINQLSHYSTDAEFNMAKRSLNYLIYHPTWPTEWSLQNVLIAWNDYLYSGDDRLVRRLYPDLQSKLLTGLAREDGLISTRTGKQTPELLRSIHYQLFGTSSRLEDIVDWPHTSILPSGETDGFVFTDYNAVVNAFYYEDLRIMDKLASALGFIADALRYRRMAQQVSRSFIHAFIDPASGLVVDGEGTKHSSLHANMFTLAFGLVPSADLPRVLAFIHSRGMACSVYGAQFLLDGLYEADDPDYALSLLTSQRDRSWFNMLREGATITMEAWGQRYKPNQDWNHAWGTAPANYIVRHFMGIQPVETGFRKVMIRPQPGKVGHAALNYLTVRGRLTEDFRNWPWRFQMSVGLPGNICAEVYLPFESGADRVTMDGRSVKAVLADHYWKIVGVGPGEHVFEVVRRGGR